MIPQFSQLSQIVQHGQSAAMPQSEFVDFDAAIEEPNFFEGPKADLPANLTKAMIAEQKLPVAIEVAPIQNRAGETEILAFNPVAFIAQGLPFFPVEYPLEKQVAEQNLHVAVDGAPIQNVAGETEILSVDPAVVIEQKQLLFSVEPLLKTQAAQPIKQGQRDMPSAKEVNTISAHMLICAAIFPDDSYPLKPQISGQAVEFEPQLVLALNSEIQLGQMPLARQPDADEGMASNNLALVGRESLSTSDEFAISDRQIKPTSLEMAWQLRVVDSQLLLGGGNAALSNVDAPPQTSSNIAVLPHETAAGITLTTQVDYAKIPSSGNSKTTYRDILGINFDPNSVASPPTDYVEAATLNGRALLPMIFPSAILSVSETTLSAGARSVETLLLSVQDLLAIEQESLLAKPVELSPPLRKGIVGNLAPKIMGPQLGFSRNLKENSSLTSIPFPTTDVANYLPQLFEAKQADPETLPLLTDDGRMKFELRQQADYLQILTVQQPETSKVIQQITENPLLEIKTSDFSGAKVNLVNWDERAGEPLLLVAPLPGRLDPLTKPAAARLNDTSPKADSVEVQDYIHLDTKPVAISGAASVNTDLAWRQSERFVQEARPAKPTGTSSNAASQIFANMGKFAPAVFEQLAPHSAAAKAGATELSLSPIELGQVKFQIHQTGDSVRVVLSAEKSETLDLLRRNSEQLLQEFKQAGFSGASLSFGQWNQQDRSAQSAVQQAALFDEDFVMDSPILSRPINNQTALPLGQGLDLRL
jgi:hypothetical protein